MRGECFLTPIIIDINIPRIDTTILMSNLFIILQGFIGIIFMECRIEDVMVQIREYMDRMGTDSKHLLIIGRGGKKIRDEKFFRI